MEKTWAEWLTIGLTASFLPWEIFDSPGTSPG